MAQTQTNPNFDDILSRPASEVERPKPLPQGSYLCIVKGLPRHDKSSKKLTPFVEFTLQPTAAGEDVDEEDLAAMGGIANKTIRATYYKTEDALWRLTDFLEHCGIDLEGKSISQAIDETPNCEVIAFIKHRASEDGQSIFAELAKTAPVE